MCVPAGVPLSIFRGRIVRSGEPRWFEDDRRWALAWQYDKDVRLPCGCHPEEASGVENVDTWSAIPRVCHRHAAIAEASERRQKSEQDTMHGVYFQTVHES